MSLHRIVDALLAAMGASRVTVRQERIGDVFPVTHEALAPGVASIKGVATPGMADQPVVLRVLDGQQVVQDDAARDFPGDEPFHAMRGLYGGLAAQIVTPVVRDGKTIAIVSVHQLGRVRTWTEAEIARCGEAAKQVEQTLGVDANQC